MQSAYERSYSYSIALHIYLAIRFRSLTDYNAPLRRRHSTGCALADVATPPTAGVSLEVSLTQCIWVHTVHG